jgi:hypothetical protein
MYTQVYTFKDRMSKNALTNAPHNRLAMERSGIASPG